MSDGCANAKGDRLSSSWGFFRILYQKALEIAQLSLEVNHPNAMPDCAIALGVGAAIAVATDSRLARYYTACRFKYTNGYSFTRYYSRSLGFDG
ncbi:MAG: hypothetical protein V7K46_18780 [Nostoc sp.]